MVLTYRWSSAPWIPELFLPNLVNWVLFCYTGVVTARVLLRLVHESSLSLCYIFYCNFTLAGILAIYFISGCLIVFFYFFSDLWECGFCFQVGWGSCYCKPWCWQTQGFGWEVCSILHPKMIHLQIFPWFCYLVHGLWCHFPVNTSKVFICNTTLNTFVGLLLTQHLTCLLACSFVFNKYCTVHDCL